MARFRNDFKEGRVVPTLGYHLVEDGDTITVPDSEWEHWEAGGWTALDPHPAPEPEPEPEPVQAGADEPKKPAAKSMPVGSEAA